MSMILDHILIYYFPFIKIQTLLVFTNKAFALTIRYFPGQRGRRNQAIHKIGEKTIFQRFRRTIFKFEEHFQ